MSDVLTVYAVAVNGDQASGCGLGTLAEPLRVIRGGAGWEQLTAWLDAIEAVQGTRPAYVLTGFFGTSSGLCASHLYL